MTTKNSPVSELKRQAKEMVRQLRIANATRVRIPPAMRAKSIKFGIVMDDKVLTIEMDWSAIDESTDVQLVEFIVKQMREES